MFRRLRYAAGVLGVLGAAGGVYQAAREFQDRRWYPAPAPLIDVGGHGLFLSCRGSGSPTVILESGLGEASAYWGWIVPAVARDTRVCAYDRAGRGWSEAALRPRDGVGIATDLHTLLERAHEVAPFVLVGHSSGAIYARIFAGRYPDDVAGMVLLDGQPADALTRLPAYPAFYRTFRRVSLLLPSLARLGLGRLIAHDDFGDLPPPARDIQRAHHSSTRQYRSLRDEIAALPTALAQAGASQGLGDRPLIVITAGRDAQAGWLPLQDEMALLSTSSVHRVLPEATHASLVDDQSDARASSQAIREVVQAVRNDPKRGSRSASVGRAR